MNNPNDPFPVPPEGAPPSVQPPYPGQEPYPAQPPYAGQPPQAPYGAPPTGQPPYAGGAPHHPYGGPPHPAYGAPPPGGNSKVLIGIIAALVLVIVVGATLYFSGAFGGGKAAGGRDYSVSAPGEAPALTSDFVEGGTWRENCGTGEFAVTFSPGGNLQMFPEDRSPVQTGTWTMSANGVSATIQGRTDQITIVPVGPDTMRATGGGETLTLVRC